MGHRPPAEGKIDRNERGLPVPAINLSMKHTRVDCEVRERLELKIPVSNRRITSRCLVRIRRNQNAWRIFDWPMEVVPTKNRGRDRQEKTKEFHAELLSRFGAGRGGYITIPPSTQMTWPVI